MKNIESSYKYGALITFAWMLSACVLIPSMPPDGASLDERSKFDFWLCKRVMDDFDYTPYMFVRQRCPLDIFEFAFEARSGFTEAQVQEALGLALELREENQVRPRVVEYLIKQVGGIENFTKVRQSHTPHSRSHRHA